MKKIIFMIITICLTGCGGESNGEPVTPIQHKSIRHHSVKDVNQTFSLNGHPTGRLDVQLNAIKNIPLPDRFKFSDIRLEEKGNIWLVTNPTPQPIKRFIAKYGTLSSILMVELDRELPPYSQGTLYTATMNIDKLKIIKQLSLFTPDVGLAGYAVNCADKTKTCYDVPNNSERLIYEKVLINIHNSFNRKSFKHFLNDYFSDSSVCKQYKDCVSYKDNKLNYATLNLLEMGINGHELNMKTMRNVYAAEGVGGGGSPNIAKSNNSSGGWASYWENYMDQKRSEYRDLNSGTYHTIFHETAHAYGFSHSSGMTYGFADKWGTDYNINKTPQSERESRVPLKLPSVIVKSENIVNLKVRN